VIGTPASTRGPSAYPTKAPIVRFLSSTATGSACASARVALGSVSLFGGVVTARSIDATHGRGTVSGFAIYGSPIALRAGHGVRIGNWGEVTLGKTVGRLTAPLVVQLLAAHHSLPAGTTIAFAFGASSQASKPSRAASGSHKKLGRQSAKQPPDFPAAASPFARGGGFTHAAEKNPVVAIAMRYLGVRYQWGGASPKTGFDCSGLVKYVFAQLGVNLIHFAAAQWHSPGGVWVAPNRLQAGDLVFFIGSDGTRKEPGHVGIYVDDGYFIDAPHTGSFVRVDRLTERKFADGYVGARRIVGASLHARHLFRATGPAASTTRLPLGIPQPLPIDPLAAAATSDNAAWAGGGLSGLALLLAAAAFLFLGSRVPETRSNPTD
jgi:cell wall-associated NlpC family hydrolase